jgi:hypothetical protein
MPSDVLYVSLGQPFLKTFYTSLDYAKNFVYLAVSTTVTFQGYIVKFPA